MRVTPRSRALASARATRAPREKTCVSCGQTALVKPEPRLGNTEICDRCAEHIRVEPRPSASATAG